MEDETIKHAAVMADNGWIFIGKSHADCFRKISNVGLDPYHNACGQGFVTSKGRFVFRDKAAEIAMAANQIDQPTKLLFSEDMWSERHNAKYFHDEIRGYIEKEKI